MLWRLRIPFSIMVVVVSCYVMNFTGLKAAQANEMSKSGNPHGGHCCDSHGSKCKSYGCGHSHDGDYASEMFALVHCAKKELLKEKMKAHLEARIGEKLDKVADLFVNAMMDKYKEMRKCEKKHDEYEQKLKEIFKEDEGRGEQGQ
ncbi:MAG: hypothetical protein NG784_13915 [Candidatus Jettenia sp.]|nr:hypothetical protein [Candidatus Jettenia sp.]